MIRPPKLKTGEKIGIISTARKITAEELAPCMEILRKWGLIPIPGPNLFAEDHQFAGTDAQRLSDLNGMIADPEIKAILCARGGYGTLRILDEVDLLPLKIQPKWIIGFSDLTPLLVRLFNEGIESIHGPMGISFKGNTANGQALEYLRKILFETGSINYSYTPENQQLLRTGMAEGPVLGGNLSMLANLPGTATDLNTAGCLLFLEDLDEYLYHIDRLMIHLKRAGKLEQIAGLISGAMTDMKDNTVPFGKDGNEIVAEAVRNEKYPVAMDFPSGHWERNYPLIVGRKATLKVSHVKVEFSFEL